MTENQPLFAVFTILHVNVFGKHVCKFFSASKLNRGASLNLMPLFGTAGIVCGGESMKRSDVCPSVCLSVRPIIRPPHVAAAGLLL